MIQGSSQLTRCLVGVTLAFTPLASVLAATFNTFTGTTVEILSILEVPNVGPSVTLGTKPETIEIDGGVDFTTMLLKFEGNATANADVANESGPAPATPLNVGNVLNLSAGVMGTALLPQGSSAQAAIKGEGGIAFRHIAANNNTYVIPLRIVSNYNIAVAQETGPTAEDRASAAATFLIETDSRGVEFDFSVFKDTEGGLSGLSTGGERFVVAIVLRPGESDALRVVTTASGFAESFVPEPGGATLLGLICLAVIPRRRRR